MGMQRQGLEFTTRVPQKAEAYFSLKSAGYVDIYCPVSNAEVHCSSVDELWKRIISHEIQFGSRIGLKSVRLSNWLPLSPGRFHTSEAQRIRYQAMHYYDTTTNEFDPWGKASMLQAGIGCIRIASEPISQPSYYMLGATSSQHAHAGIPVRIPTPLIRDIRSRLFERGFVDVSLAGRVAATSRHESQFQHDPRTPSAFIEVEEIGGTDGIAEQEPLFASVAIGFCEPLALKEFLAESASFSESEAAARSRLPFYYSFGNFRIQEGEQSLSRTVSWLEDYAVRHTREGRPVIFSDFDDTTAWFDIDTFVSLSRMNSGLFSLQQLRQATSRSKQSVFLSYRSTDAGGDIMAHVGRVFDFLKTESATGSVFWDKRSLRAGQNWRMALEDGIQRSDAVMAFIGPEWQIADTATEHGDLVFQELAWAKRYDKPVLPVMLGGRRISDLSLPSGLEFLKETQHCILDHADFQRFKVEVQKFLASL